VKHRQAECAEPSAFCCCLPRAAGDYSDLSLQEWSTAARVPLKERSTASSAAKATYELAWDCSMALTERGMRGELALDVAVQDFGAVTVPIMSKVYAHGDSSAAHGERCGRCCCGCYTAARRAMLTVAWLSCRPAAAQHHLRVWQERAHGRGEALQRAVQQVSWRVHVSCCYRRLFILHT
jgi:hypothetical protein